MVAVLRSFRDFPMLIVTLILGRFMPKQKAVLEALREEVKKGGRYIPTIFDFKKPERLALTETTVTLAHLSRFVSPI